MLLVQFPDSIALASPISNNQIVNSWTNADLRFRVAIAIVDTFYLIWFYYASLPSMTTSFIWSRSDASENDQWILLFQRSRQTNDAFWIENYFIYTNRLCILTRYVGSCQEEVDTNVRNDSLHYIPFSVLFICCSFSECTGNICTSFDRMHYSTSILRSAIAAPAQLFHSSEPIFPEHSHDDSPSSYVHSEKQMEKPCFIGHSTLSVIGDRKPWHPRLNLIQKKT